MFNYHQRNSHVVLIGNCPLGGHHPIRLQSMANTSTLDTNACVEQSIAIIEAGAHYVRFTAQGVREAENLSLIKEALLSRGYTTPLIADIHFNAAVADVAATRVEKVRINPGNYVDPARTFVQHEYTDKEYATEVAKIKERFTPFLHICRTHNTAIRIGVNHGSLSDRIMSRYGDTPAGMVESCMEFLRICAAEQFDNVVISIKASNTVIMVTTVRLLVETMEKESITCPLHLGVTEAGEGEDGRIKSAVGIGALLADGIGDTIRVSLSEAPEQEIPVARALIDYVLQRRNHPLITGNTAPYFSYTDPTRRNTKQIKNIGGERVPVVISYRPQVGSTYQRQPFTPDYLYIGSQPRNTFPTEIACIVDVDLFNNEPNTFPLYTAQRLSEAGMCPLSLTFVEISLPELSPEILKMVQQNPALVLIATTQHRNPVGELRALIHLLTTAQCTNPIVAAPSYTSNDLSQCQLMASVDLGTLLIDRLIDGVAISNEGSIPLAAIDETLFSILQATRQRMVKTEYISCPGCGRTLFDLAETIAHVKAATSHLSSLKIGIMGCIVNGPGEMADADYGYVGAGRGQVSLYKGRTCVEKNIDQSIAVERLIALIKENNDWTDPQ